MPFKKVWPQLINIALSGWRSIHYSKGGGLQHISTSHSGYKGYVITNANKAKKITTAPDLENSYAEVVLISSGSLWSQQSTHFQIQVRISILWLWGCALCNLHTFKINGGSGGKCSVPFRSEKQERRRWLVPIKPRTLSTMALCVLVHQLLAQLGISECSFSRLQMHTDRHVVSGFQ